MQKTRKLIERDKVDVIFGDVNSGIAYAMSQVTSELKVFHIVPGGHTDPITGTDCKWNVFRICNTTSMDAAAVTGDLVKRFGKKFFFITPDYAYGHTLQDSFIKNLKALGGEYQAEMLPINTSEFSATLIKAKAYKPNVLLNNMGGLAQINCMKQFTQFGMQKEMALGGALFELETVKAVPTDAQAGSWDMEWWWNQPNVPEVAAFVADFRKATGKTPTARHWFGLCRRRNRSVSAPKRPSRSKARSCRWRWRAWNCRRMSRCSPASIFYRAGDHQLMSNIFVGDVHPPAGGNPDDVFTVTSRGAGRESRRFGRRHRLQDGPSRLTPTPERLNSEGRPMLQLVLFNVTNGLIIGAFYVLMALGLSLILNLSNVINFAHGNFLALGGYIAFVLTPYIGFWGALLVSPILTALFGFLIERLMIRRVYSRDPVYSLLLTFGLAFIMQDVCRYIWGPNGLPMTIPDILSTPLSADLFFITWYRIFMVAIVIAAVAGLFAFLRYTRVGIRIRAGTLDLDTVAALGVNVGMLRSFNFAVGSLLAGLAGVLAAGQIGLNPNMGDDLLMPSFIAIIVGGVGSLTGTLLGGLLIGVAGALTTVVWPAASEAVIYVIMLVVLVLRPRGLMGEEGMLT